MKWIYFIQFVQLMKCYNKIEYGTWGWSLEIWPKSVDGFLGPSFVDCTC